MASKEYRLSVRLPVAVVSRLRLRARFEDRTLQAVVLRAIAGYLERTDHGKGKPEPRT